jgi:hypothetical protein
VTLTQLLAADIETQRQWALVFGVQLTQALQAKWQQHGSVNAIPNAILLTDGRYMLPADVLSEVLPGGLLHAMWAASDHAAIAAGTTVLPWSEAVAMIPPSEGLQ